MTRNLEYGGEIVEQANLAITAADTALLAWSRATEKYLDKRREADDAHAEVKRIEAEIKIKTLQDIDAAGLKTNAEQREAQVKVALAADDEYRDAVRLEDQARDDAARAETDASIQAERAKLRRVEIGFLTALLGGRT